LLDREAAKRVISLDPNIRPGFIKDKAAHMARIKRMAAKSDILKFSDEDLEWFGLDGSHDDLAAYWLKHGAKLVVITKGAEGASGYTSERKVTVPSQRVTVVDTVGAGDTFDAGVLASLKMDGLLTKAQVAALDEKALTNALSLGAKAAAVTVSRAGANPPWAKEIGL
jgi:fructokinase